MTKKFKFFLNILIFISLSLLIYTLYLKSYITSLYTPTGHLDGAFQTASALFRLSNQETLAKDFFFYLGIGPLYLLYPFFKLAGANLAASVLVSFFSVKVIYILTIFF